MAICSACGQEETTAESCTHTLIEINGKVYRRVAERFDRGRRCHDCGIINKRGNVHHAGCDMEWCPRCGNQLLTCDCKVGNTIRPTVQEYRDRVKTYNQNKGQGGWFRNSAAHSLAARKGAMKRRR